MRVEFADMVIQSTSPLTIVMIAIPIILLKLSAMTLKCLLADPSEKPLLLKNL
jgi:hypothetical protein